MNLFRFCCSYSLIYDLLFVWLINFDCLFGCLSTPYKKKGELNLNHNQRQGSKITDLLVITQYREYISQKYNWSLKISDLEFLWVKLKEFSRIIKKNKKPRRYKIEKPKKVISNFTFINIVDIENFLNKKDKEESIIIGILNVESSSPKISNDGTRVFVPKDMRLAMQAARTFHSTACNLRNVTFCNKQYLEIENNVDDNYQYLPPSINIKRCPSKCSCIHPEETCLPTSIQTRIEYFLTIKNSREMSTWLLRFDDHTGCSCRKRCLNRKCITPFKLKDSGGGICSCVCIPGKESTCAKVLGGYEKFSEKDYKCIVNGTCLTPACRDGELSEENLYLRKCPKML